VRRAYTRIDFIPIGRASRALPWAFGESPVDVEEQECRASTPSLRRRLTSPRLIIGRRPFVWDMPAWGQAARHQAELEAVVGAPLMLIA
jgi:hypothetical protein